MDGRPLRRVVLAGGYGHLGSCVRRLLTANGYETTIVTRSPRSEGDVSWAGKAGGSLARALEGATAVVNLCGSPISNPWTPANWQDIVESRLGPVRIIADALRTVGDSSVAWINGCAIGYYGDTGEVSIDESGGPGSGRLADLCQRWEAAVLEPEGPGRRVILRTGSVLGSEGMLPALTRLSRWFLGGAHGSGRQWVSWIHERDFAHAVLFAIEQCLEGPINVVSDAPVRNRELMADIRRRCNRPWVPNAPAWAMRLAGRFGAPDASLALMSSRVAPERLRRAGFEWEFPSLGSALDDLLPRR